MHPVDFSHEVVAVVYVPVVWSYPIIQFTVLLKHSATKWSKIYNATILFEMKIKMQSKSFLLC